MPVMRSLLATSRIGTISFLIVNALAATIAGCAPNSPQPVIAKLQMATAPASDRQGDASVVFFDADVFDLTLADELKLGTDQVHVNFAAPTSLNSFPPRMNTWLAEVKKTDGKISVVDPSHPPGTRGIFGIGMIFDLIDAINTMQTRRALAQRMALVDVYDAKILYDSANGMAREVVFTRRPAVAGASPPGDPAPAASPEPERTPE